MTHRDAILILALAATSTNVASLAAHVGDRLYPISYLSEETLAALDQDDASVEDWLEAVGEPALTLLDFNLASRPSASYDQLDPSNLDFRIWLGWSRDGRIHFAGEFADDAYVNEYDPDARLENFKWLSDFDSITLIVDGDHSGYSSASETKEVQTYDAIARVPSGPMVRLLGATDPHVDKKHWWMVHPPFARGGGGVLGENPTFWVIEFFATCFDRLNHLNPEDAVVSQLSEGGIIGFRLFVRDYDRQNSHRHARYHNGEGLGMTDGVLLGPGGSGDSAVQSVSWGRIKASLE